MAVGYKGSSVGTTSVASMPPHVAGDLLIGFAFRDGSATGPSVPSGWTQVERAGANTCSITVAYKWAASSAEVSGTWTSATSVVIASYSGVNTETPIGGYTVTGGSSTLVTYGALSSTDPINQSWFVAFSGHRSVNTTLETPPPGMVARNVFADTVDEIALFDTDGGASGWASTNVSVGGTSSGWRAIVLELKEVKSVELSGSISEVGVETYNDIYTAIIPVSTMTYFAFGYVESGYVENDIPLTFEEGPVAKSSDQIPHSDRAKFDLSGATDQIPSSDRAASVSIQNSTQHQYSHTDKVEEYRRSAYRVSGGFASTRHTSRLVSGVGVPTSTSREAGNVLSVELESATLSLDVTGLTTVEASYGAESLGAVWYFHTDRFGDSVSVPNVFTFIHDVGGPPPTAYWSLDLEYSLLSDAPQLHEWAFYQEYALVFPIPEWNLDQEWEQQALVLIEWDLSQQWVNGAMDWQVDMFYAVSGSEILHQFKLNLNTLRDSLGLPPYEICIRAVPDIAQQHCIHQRALERMSHDSLLYPIGWQTMAERGAQLGYSYRLSENLAALVTERRTTDTVTGYDVYEAWLNSPPHYANMVYDYGPDAILEFQLGAEFYLENLNVEDLYSLEANEYYWYSIYTLNLIDFNYLSGGEKVAAEFLLNSQYELQTPTRENLDMFWDTRAYSSLRKRFTTPYAMRVAASHTSMYGTYITVAHTARMQYSVQVAMTNPYGATTFVDAAHTATYNIEQYAKVTAEHSAKWSIAHTFKHTVEYDDAAWVRASHVATYEDKPSVVRSHTASYDETVMVRAYSRYPYSDSATVHRQHTSPYALVGYVIKGHTAHYADQVPVTTSHSSLYELLTYDPVIKSHRSSYSILSGDAVSVEASYSVAINGFEIDCKSIRLDMDEGEPYWTGSIGVSDPEIFAAISRGDTVSIDFYGEVFNLIVDSKTIRRDSPVDVELTVTALSPVALLDEPYVEPIDRTQVTAVMARDLVQDLLGQSVTWEVHNWVVMPYRFAVTQRSPLAAARMVIEAVGGVLRSNPDGTLVASYKFPVTIPDYEATLPVFSVSDIENNLNYNGRIQNMEVFNEFRVRDGQDYQSDYFEWKQDEGSIDSGILRAYVLPWRPATVETQHTSTGAVNMIYLGIESRTETQEVEIVNGSAQLTWPAVSISAVEWLSDPLGDIYLESRTKEIKVPDTDTNWGYGLARITYTVECLKYSVQSPVGSSVQFILVDRGM